MRGKVSDTAASASAALLAAAATATAAASAATAPTTVAAAATTTDADASAAGGPTAGAFPAAPTVSATTGELSAQLGACLLGAGQGISRVVAVRVAAADDQDCECGGKDGQHGNR
ncbi:hypothetical protein ACFYV7_12140 [Nocardia suismassiliense]|uniref:Secreted protein n=1 Tax=Nocardia suismassiliense TaxID=2077092 RepID=A0ABW6QRF3_9NOCA